jgi:hypothetical protein
MSQCRKPLRKFRGARIRVAKVRNSNGGRVQNIVSWEDTRTLRVIHFFVSPGKVSMGKAVGDVGPSTRSEIIAIS